MWIDCGHLCKRLTANCGRPARQHDCLRCNMIVCVVVSLKGALFVCSIDRSIEEIEKEHFTGDLQHAVASQTQIKQHSALICIRRELSLMHSTSPAMSRRKHQPRRKSCCCARQRPWPPTRLALPSLLLEPD